MSETTRLFDPSDIKHLSVSQINDYLRCPMLWYGSRIGKWPQEPVFVMQAGVAIHKALTCYHRGEDEQVGLLTAWKEITAEIPRGSIQQAISAIGLYSERVKPVPHDAAGWWFDVPIPGLPILLKGEFDLLRVHPDQPSDGAIIDWKTGAPKWGQPKADTELQATAYWYAYQQETLRLSGEALSPAKFVYVQLRTSQSPAAYKVIVTTRTQDDVDKFLDLCREVYHRMLHDPITSTCPKGWCRYPEQCGRES